MAAIVCNFLFAEDFGHFELKSIPMDSTGAKF